MQLSRDDRSALDNTDRNPLRRPDGSPGYPAGPHRNPGDVVRLLMGGLVLLVLAAVARRGRPAALEVNLFRLINNLPSFLNAPLTVVMQFGSLTAVPVAAAVALTIRRFRLALALAAGGSLAWALARVVKDLVDRGRPAALVEHALTRGAAASGHGFPSGHVAVAAALATVASPYLTRPARRVIWVLVGVVAVARTYLGAHLPVDAVGGAALGWAIGAAVQLLLGAPSGNPSSEFVERELPEAGFTGARVLAAAVDARGSAPFHVRLEDGAELFVKVVSREQRNADWLFKAWRFLAFREVEDEAPFATPKQQVEHEAYVALLSERAGVRTPRVITAGTLDRGIAFLATERVGGKSLDLFAPEDVHDALIVDVWKQISLLHRGRIAHRDLRRANLLVDDEGRPWILDFGFGEAAASDRRLAEDIAEMLVSLGAVVGPRRALLGLVDAVGQEGLEKALPLIQPLVLSAATRRELRGHDRLLEELRAECAKAVGTQPPPLEPIARVTPRSVLTLVGAAFAIHLLLPQLGELKQIVEVVRSARWDWLLAGALASVLTYIMAAVALSGAVSADLSQGLAFGRTLAVQVASSFANRLAPAGLGGVGTQIRYLQRAGVDRAAAVGAVALNTAAGFVVHVLGLVASIALVGGVGLKRAPLPQGWALLIAAVAVLTTSGVVLWYPRARRRILEPARQMSNALLQTLRRPGQAARLFGGSVGITGGYVLALIASLEAFGAHTPLVGVTAVYLGGSAVASASPTPGGLGALEATLVAGLIAIGTAPAAAVAGVLTFRLLTFWLPILPGVLIFRYLQRRQAL